MTENGKVCTTYAYLGPTPGSLAGAITSGKMLAEAAKFQEFHGLTDEQRQDFFTSAALIIKRHIGSEAHAKVLALQRGVEWESLDLA